MRNFDQSHDLEATRRQAERLEVHAAELERVRRALERHARELERSLAARSRFFTVMSHELRTPLNAILGYNQLLMQGAYGPLSPAQQEAAAKIAASATQLLHLVDEVLDLSKIDAGKIEIRWESLDMGALAAETASSVEVTARLKGLDFHVRTAPDLPTIRSDRGRVRQILLNLLANAVKFTEHGRVSLEVRHLTPDSTISRRPPAASPGADGWIAVSVHDTGSGIPADQLDAIFGEFFQLPDRDAPQRHGTGLGLAISIRLARILGGDLTVESEVGVATTFTLFLPCPEPGGAAAAGQREAIDLTAGHGAAGDPADGTV